MSKMEIQKLDPAQCELLRVGELMVWRPLLGNQEGQEKAETEAPAQGVKQNELKPSLFLGPA